MSYNKIGGKHEKNQQQLVL